MKYIIKEGPCTIVLDSSRDDKSLEYTLRAIACMMAGVEVGSMWPQFSTLMREVNQKLLSGFRGCE